MSSNSLLTRYELTSYQVNLLIRRIASYSSYFSVELYTSKRYKSEECKQTYIATRQLEILYLL